MSRLTYILMESLSKPFTPLIEKPIITHSDQTQNVTTVNNITDYIERLQENILYRVRTSLDGASYGLRLGDNFDNNKRVYVSKRVAYINRNDQRRINSGCKRYTDNPG